MRVIEGRSALTEATTYCEKLKHTLWTDFVKSVGRVSSTISQPQWTLPRGNKFLAHNVYIQ